MINDTDSWMTGINTNVEGKSLKSIVSYTESVQEYKKWYRNCRESGHQPLILDSKVPKATAGDVSQGP